MLKRVISGGQSGADKAGLVAAKAVGLATGGTVPRGWRTENGSDLSLRDFGVMEHSDSAYPPRTRKNVHDSDGTIIIASKLDGGSNLTAGICRMGRKPMLHVAELTPAMLVTAARWIEDNRIETLNVAGNRESKSPGLQVWATRWLQALFIAITTERAKS
jgi:putative molybdenum carrier protein